MLGVIAVALLLITVGRGSTLILRDPDTGLVYGRYPLSDGDAFSVCFVHSVNRTPYYDLYELRGGRIYLTGLRYYSFGAGVPEELDPSWRLELPGDGSMLVTGMDTPLSNIIYRVGTVSDHILILPDGQQIGLTQLCGRNSRVELCIR